MGAVFSCFSPSQHQVRAPVPTPPQRGSISHVFEAAKTPESRVNANKSASSMSRPSSTGALAELASQSSVASTSTLDVKPSPGADVAAGVATLDKKASAVKKNAPAEKIPLAPIKEQKDNNGLNVLMHAIQGGSEASMAMLLSRRQNHPADLNDALMHLLSPKLLNERMFDMLLEQGADVNGSENATKPNPWYKQTTTTTPTPLGRAFGCLLAAHGYDLLSSDRPNLKTVRNSIFKLLEKGAGANCLVSRLNRSRDLFTPLYAAVLVRDQELVEKLLEAKADPREKGFSGSTPLMCAIQDKNLNCVKLLLDAKGGVYDTDNLGRTPQMLATRSTPEILSAVLTAVDAAESKKTNS